MFRRRKADVEQVDEADQPTTADAAPGGRATGPWDASEVSIDEDAENRIDLGSLLITPHDALEVQLQVDEASEQVVAAVLAGEDGAAELRAFAAPRHGDIWESSRRALAAEVAQLGGTATEREGPWGTELVVSLMVDLPDGQRAQQQSVVVGIAGPRWLLRATLFGRPAVAYAEDGDIESALREIIVVRGGAPVPPGDALPLTMPPDARRTGPEAD
jgi:Protein of unknown function (DUF3710)